MEQYESISALIRTLAIISKNGTDIKDELKKLLLARARIISSAEEKLPALLRSIKVLMENNQREKLQTRDILIYCAPGHHSEVLQAVSKLGLRCHEFVHDVSLPEREKLLRQFANGDIQVLVAIRCLDEGVDVPSTRVAFILASSTNPREFVQRRGRILRQAEGKSEAIIFDFIVVPPQERWVLKNETDACILKREMPRFVEFASSALNQFQARSVVRDMLNRYEMLNLLDEKPWAVYHNLKQWDWRSEEHG